MEPGRRRAADAWDRGCSGPEDATFGLLALPRTVPSGLFLQRLLKKLSNPTVKTPEELEIHLFAQLIPHAGHTHPRPDKGYSTRADGAATSILLFPASSSLSSATVRGVAPSLFVPGFGPSRRQFQVEPFSSALEPWPLARRSQRSPPQFFQTRRRLCLLEGDKSPGERALIGETRKKDDSLKIPNMAMPRWGPGTAAYCCSFFQTHVFFLSFCALCPIVSAFFFLIVFLQAMEKREERGPETKCKM